MAAASWLLEYKQNSVRVIKQKCQSWAGHGTEHLGLLSWTECLGSENEWRLLELEFPSSHVPTAAQGVPLTLNCQCDGAVVGSEADLYHMVI